MSRKCLITGAAGFIGFHIQGEFQVHRAAVSLFQRMQDHAHALGKWRSPQQLIKGHHQMFRVADDVAADGLKVSVFLFLHQVA